MAFSAMKVAIIRKIKIFWFRAAVQALSFACVARLCSFIAAQRCSVRSIATQSYRRTSVRRNNSHVDNREPGPKNANALLAKRAKQQ